MLRTETDRNCGGGIPWTALIVTGMVVVTLLGAGVGAVAGSSGDGTNQQALAGQDEAADDEITFTVESQGGFIAFSEDTIDEAEEEGVEFPVAEDGENPIQFAATVDADGNWETTESNFPNLPVSDSMEAEVETVDGMSGTIDTDEETMTASGELEVTIDGNSFAFEVELTSAESGELTGEADFDSEPAAVTLVDNEFIVDDTTDSLIDTVLELPADSPGENWFNLILDVDFDGEELGDIQTEEEDSDNDESTTDLGLSVLGQAFGIIGIAGSLLTILVTLVAKAGVISLDS